jgi:CubicO group peptidase (beta-lactamase class C family)
MPDEREPNARAHLRRAIDEYRSRSVLPAVGVGLTSGADLLLRVARGERQWKKDAPIGASDRYCLGSISKPLTGLLVARLIDQGTIAWHTSIGEVFPELIEWLKSDKELFPGFSVPRESRRWADRYARVTVADLMSHSSGLSRMPRSVNEEELLGLLDVPAGSTPSKNLRAKRKMYARVAMLDEPGSDPETQRGEGLKPHCYSGGCIIVASMLEELTGDTWEELMKTHVFKPLGIKRYAFGRLSSSQTLDGPRYHLFDEDGVLHTAAHLNTSQIAYTHAPAGAVCLSLRAFGRIVSEVASNASGFLKPETWREYTTLCPPGVTAPFTLGGWSVNQVPTAIAHNGDNGWSRAHSEVNLENGTTGYAFTNISGQRGIEATEDLTKEALAMAEGWDLFRFLHQAVPARSVTLSSDDGASGSPPASVMNSAEFATGWKSRNNAPWIDVEFAREETIRGIALYQPTAGSVHTVKFDFGLDDLRPAGPPEMRPAEPSLGPMHLMSDNRHVLHVFLPGHRTLRRFRIRIWQGHRPMRINRLIVLRAQ